MYKYKPISLIIEGGIGAGKNTFIGELIKELNKKGITYKQHTEEMYIKRELGEYYEKSKKRAYDFQKGIIGQRIEQLKEKYESEKYQNYVQQTVEQLTKELENQINHFVINVMYNYKGEIYLSQRIEQNKEYYLNHQVPGGRMQENETIEQACIRETKEETGILLTEKRLQHIVTEQKEKRKCELFMTK